MVDKAKILAGREAVEAYREAHAQLHHRVQDGRALPIDHSGIMGKMLSGLKALGFNSMDEFMEANEAANREEMNRCIVYEGECDFCKGRERGCDQSCYEQNTELDETTSTGRTRLIPGKGKVATLKYYKEYYKSLPPRTKGVVYPTLPGCSIKTRIAETPELDWTWE